MHADNAASSFCSGFRVRLTVILCPDFSVIQVHRDQFTSRFAVRASLNGRPRYKIYWYLCRAKLLLTIVILIGVNRFITRYQKMLLCVLVVCRTLFYFHAVSDYSGTIGLYLSSIIKIFVVGFNLLMLPTVLSG
jgi:hypothetical protein